MKRFGAIRSSNAATAVENYEHMMMCLICRSLFDDHDHQPKFLPCHHTFCKDCLREYVRQMGDDIECPSCRKVATIPAAGVAALQTNFYAKYIQTLVYGSGTGGVDGDAGMCQQHPKRSLKYYCEVCSLNICDLCVELTGCSQHHHVSVAAVVEHYRQGLDSSFTEASTHIGRKKTELEGKLRALADEKDRALLKIDSAFESHAHTLARRSTLLKNKVIDIYNESAAALESGLEEVDTAMTCVVSLREYYDAAVLRGDFASVGGGRGSEEIDEVARNICDRVRPPEVHLVFDGEHGADKFKSCTKDLGRVVCNKSKAKLPDDVSGDGRVALMSCNSDSNLQSPLTEESGRSGKRESPGDLAPSDTSCFNEVIDIQHTCMAPVNAAHGDQTDLGCFPTGNSVPKDSNSGSDALQFSSTGVHLSVVERPANEPSILDSCTLKSPSGSKMCSPLKGNNENVENYPTVNNQFCNSSFHSPNQLLKNVSGVKNNNYCNSAQSLVGTASLNADNIPALVRPHMSYDEQHLRRELDTLDIIDDQEDVPNRLSQSEMWHIGSGDRVLSYSDDRENAIAEFSGEQTTL